MCVRLATLHINLGFVKIINLHMFYAYYYVFYVNINHSLYSVILFSDL